MNTQKLTVIFIVCLFCLVGQWFFTAVERLKL